MKFHKVTALAIFLCVALQQLLFCQESKTSFTASLNPATLTFNGAGAYAVNVLVTHDGTGESTFSGMSIKFGELANALLGVLSDGATINGATRGIAFVGEGFVFEAGNNLAWMLAFAAANSDVGVMQIAIFFSLRFSLAGQLHYDMGLDFIGTQRNSALTG